MRLLELMPIARRRRGPAAVLASAALICAALAPAPASAHHAIRLPFQKHCMGASCTGTLTTPSGRPIAGTTVSASLAPSWFESDVVGFSATETITSSRRGSFTMNHLGVQDLKASPDAIHVLGTVVSGSWNGVPLAGALVFIRASGFSSDPYTVRGVVWVQPPRHDD
jgi:hypothetical protein